MLENIVNGLKKYARYALMASALYLPIGCYSQYVKPEVGVVIPATVKEKSPGSSVLIGLDYGIRSVRYGFETGLDYFQFLDEYSDTDAVLLKLDGILILKDTEVQQVYLSAGATALFETTDIDIPEFEVHETETSTTGGIEFGAGINMNKWNIKAVYVLMPNSGNVTSLVKITAGHNF